MSSLLHESELRQEFLRRRTRQRLLVIPAALIIIAMQMVDSQETYLGLSSTAVHVLGLALIVGVLVFSLRNWRCPACSEYLGRGINPSFCSKCGFKLQE